MKLKLKQMYLGRPAGSFMTLGRGVAILLIQRGVAEEVTDPDGDGKHEGGREGEKKAFSRPPQSKKGGK